MFFANYEVSKLTGYGMPGVWHFGFMDAWSPGYLAIAAQNHNGMLRMYEIFNQQGANTKKARFTGAQTARQWYRPNPMTGEVDWSIRNSINYSETAVLTALELTSKVPAMVVENYYKKSVNAVNRGADEGALCVCDPGRAGRSDEGGSSSSICCALQAVEVQRATSEIKVKEGTFPAGSYMVKLNQPVRSSGQDADREADLSGCSAHDLRRQRLDDGPGEQHRREDDRGQDDPRCAGALLTADVVTAGHVAGSARSRWRVCRQAERLAQSHHTALSPEGCAGEGVQGVVQGWRRGLPRRIAACVPASDRAQQEIETLGLVGDGVGVSAGRSHGRRRSPRLAIFTTWSNTEKVGWVRLAFDRFEIPFDLIHKDHVKQGNLRAKYDVIVMPHQGNSGKSIVYEQPKLSKPLPYKKSDQFKSLGIYTETDDVRGGMGLEGAAEFQKFVDDGGVLMTMGIASTSRPSSASRRASTRKPRSLASTRPARTCRARS